MIHIEFTLYIKIRYTNVKDTNNKSGNLSDLSILWFLNEMIQME